MADLSHVIDEFELEGTSVMWESLWRKGEDTHWRSDLVEHDTLPPFNPRDQTILLDELRAKAVEEFANLRQQAQQSEQQSQSELESQTA